MNFVYILKPMVILSLKQIIVFFCITGLNVFFYFMKNIKNSIWTFDLRLRSTNYMHKTNSW